MSITMTTECGCKFQISAENEAAWQSEIKRLCEQGKGAQGATFDCHCGELCLAEATGDERLVWGRLFHLAMHDQDERWPTSGQDTYSTEF